MKILHINEHLARKGGVETYLLSLLPKLEAHGHAQHVVYGAGDPSEYANATCVSGVGHVGFAEQASIRRNVEEVLRHERPDVIHIHNFQNVGVLQASLDYGPTIMHTHDYRSICPASTLFYKRTQEVCGRHCGIGCFRVTATKHCVTPRPKYASYFYYRSKWVLKHRERLAHVIAPSGDTKERLSGAGFNPQHISVLPYYCPIEPASEPRAVPQRTTITYIGRIASNKGHEYFVEALGVLPSSVYGTMVGNFTDSAEADIFNLAKKHGCTDRLVLRKWATREEVLQILDQTTILIFPSLWPETLGIVGLEALARGVPVVASDIGGVREWLYDGKNGRLVQPKAPTEISQAVQDIVSTEEKLLAFGAHGIHTITERFLASTHMNALMRIYERAAAQPN